MTKLEKLFGQKTKFGGFAWQKEILVHYISYLDVQCTLIQQQLIRRTFEETINKPCLFTKKEHTGVLEKLLSEG
jgi:hypothetical protein